MKKILVLVLALAMITVAFAACGNNNDQDNQGGTTTTPINVLTREEGSGTRGAFIELFGIETDEGDQTIATAETTNSTSVMLMTVKGDPDAIGYISLGSLSSDVKAVKIDGAEASVETVKDGSYKVSRPFNIATKGTPSAEAQDFINFIMSQEGQAVIEEAGYISEGNQGAFTSTNPSGEIVVAGSSSVTPVMEKLVEAYNAINPDLTISVQQSDSTTGMTSTMEGVCDIGMASRELKDEELESLTPVKICIDGIAVIVNNENAITDLTSQQVLDIYTGKITTWEELAA